MNRRVACIGLLALLKASVVSSFALAAQEAAKTVARIAGPRWNVNGDWTPSIEEIQNHLRDAHGIDPSGRDVEDLEADEDEDDEVESDDESDHEAGDREEEEDER